MDNKFNIKKYIKFSLASNIIFNNLIFGCCKKGNKGDDKGGNNKGCCGKGNKSEENNITSNEEQPKNETPNEETLKKPGTPDKPEKQKKDYKNEIAKLLEQLSNIEKNNNFLPEKKITFNKTELESKINSIDSDEKVNKIKIELNNLGSELNKNLNELKSDYNIRFQEITEGNKKLILNIAIDLKKKDIDGLDFDKNSSNINGVKTKLETLETQYFDKLTLKCKELKTKYDNLVKDKDKLEEGPTKKQVEELCNLSDKNFEIKKYIDYNNLNEQINKIDQLIKGNEKSLKEIFQNNYKKYSDINNALDLNINDFTEELSNKINNFKLADFSDIDNTLNEIYKSITAKITELNGKFKKEYDEITEKIGFFNSTKKDEEKFNYTSITINIDEKTEKTVYEKLVNNIKNLKNSLTTKLSELKGNYETKINDLNTKLGSLGLDETNLINNNILDNLTFENLANNTIPNIEKAINEAENNCNTKIEEAKKKKEEEEKKKKKEDDEKKRQDIIKNFRDGYKIEGSDNLTIKLEDKKFKLYFKETTLIAESETEINEKDIKTADDYKNSTYTIILSFTSRCTHKITNLEIDDIIKNINYYKNHYNTSTDHCFLLLNYTYNGDKYNHFYDVNTGYLCVIYNIYSNINLKEKIFPLFYLKIDENGKISCFTNKVLFKDKYGKAVPKDKTFYFEEDDKIKDINDEISKEAIEKFSDISLFKEE